jgi:hypothetical protein
LTDIYWNIGERHYEAYGDRLVTHRVAFAHFEQNNNNNDNNNNNNNDNVNDDNNNNINNTF